MSGPNGLPPEVVAAVAAAVAAYMERDLNELRLDIRGPIPVERLEAGAFRLMGVLGPSTDHGQGGRR